VIGARAADPIEIYLVPPAADPIPITNPVPYPADIVPGVDV